MSGFNGVVTHKPRKRLFKNNNDVANRMLDHLRASYPSTVQTPILVTGLGLRDTDNNRTWFRNVLDSLCVAKHVEKHGEGKFRWRITAETMSEGWNRNDPFAPTRPGYTPPPAKDEDDEEGLPLPPRPSQSYADRDHADRETSAEYVLRREFNAWKEQAAGAERTHVQTILELRQDLEEKENRLDQLEKLAATASQHIKELKIERYDGKIIKLKNVTLPSYFDKLIDLAKVRENILLVGPAGCGKSTVAELLAKTLGLDFGKVGGYGGLTETDLLGGKTYNLMKGTEEWNPTEFVTRFEKGGVMLIDELDGADSNVMLALNPALDKSNLLPLPNRKTPAKKHKDFVCIATANTFGRGATRIYAGRNQLDGATLNRFPMGVVEVYYDDAIEKAVCPDDDLRDKIQGIRRRMEEAGVRQIISTRTIESAYKMQEVCKWNWETIEGQIFQGWTRDEVNKVKN